MKIYVIIGQSLFYLQGIEKRCKTRYIANGTWSLQAQQHGKLGATSKPYGYSFKPMQAAAGVVAEDTQ